MNTELLNIENYVLLMTFITFVAGLNFGWLYSTTNHLVESNTTLLVCSILYALVCFFTYNYYLIAKVPPFQATFFFFGFSSLLALLSLQFFSEAATRNTVKWKTWFAIHIAVAITTTIYFFIY